MVMEIPTDAPPCGTDPLKEMASNRTQEPKAAVERSVNGNGSALGPESLGSALDKVGAIRDILFGEQMSHYEVRFAELERKLTADFELLSQKMEQAIEDLRSATRDRAAEVESSSVPRLELAGELEKLAGLLRGSPIGR